MGVSSALRCPAVGGHERRFGKLWYIVPALDVQVGAPVRFRSRGAHQRATVVDCEPADEEFAAVQLRPLLPLVEAA